MLLDQARAMRLEMECGSGRANNRRQARQGCDSGSGLMATAAVWNGIANNVAEALSGKAIWKR